MYKKLLLLTLIFIGGFIGACHKTSNENHVVRELAPAYDTSNLIDFKGIKVNHRFSTPVEYLEAEHTTEFLKQVYKKIKEEVALKKGIAPTSVTDDLPGPETILEGAKRVFGQFPYGEIKEELDEHIGQELDSVQLAEIERLKDIKEEQEAEKNVEMIRKDFPTLSEEELNNNIDLIDEYYAQNLNYIVLSEIANNELEITDEILQRRKTQGFRRGKDDQIANTMSDFGRFKCILTNYQKPWKFLVPSILRPGKKSFNYTLSIIALGLAGDQAKTTSENFYGDLEYSNTRRDAYRHMVWSALLAQYYYTISSKVKRLNFAEAVGYANETCGTNPVDGREMDYHNNAIGRKIWDDNTSYKKFLWMTVGLHKSSPSTLKNIARRYVNTQSCFIVKRKDDRDFPENLLSRTQTAEEIKAKILQTDKNTPVYFIGPIAPPTKYERERVKEYDYTPCYNGDYNNCPRVVYKYIKGKAIPSCYTL